MKRTSAGAPGLLALIVIATACSGPGRPSPAQVQHVRSRLQEEQVRHRPVVGDTPDHLVSSGRFEVSNDSSHRSNSAIRGVA